MCEYTVQNLSTHGINEIPKDFYLLIWATEDAATGDRLRPRDSLSADARFFFIFTFFKKKLQKYILVFKIYSSIPLPPGRGAAGPLPPPAGR